MGNTQTQENNNTKKNIFSRIFNIIPDTPDIRDIYYQQVEKKDKHIVDYIKEMSLIPELNIHPECNLVYNICLILYMYFKETKQDISFPYINYIFYNSLLLENKEEVVTKDSFRISIRNCLKSINYYGIYCYQGLTNNSNIFTRPDLIMYKDAKHIKLQYYRIKKNIKNILGVLADGNLIIFNYSIYNSFISEKTKRTGHIFCPESNEKMIGMNSSIIIGYNEKREELILKFNSSRSFGDNGIGYIPYKYIEKNCCDFWVINKNKLLIEENKNNNHKNDSYIYIDNSNSNNNNIDSVHKRRII
jgi:hypothetical protein